MLNPIWLRTFAVLCETESFTQTARRLNMTQPGVSQHLKKLEHQTGQNLVVRAGRAFSLTPAGTKVRDFGEIQRKAEAELLKSLTFDDPGKGSCAVGCSGSFALLLFPQLLSLMKPAPDLALHLHSAPQAQLIDGLLDGTLDLGILNKEPSHSRLAGEHIGAEELCLIAPTALGTGQPAFITLQELGFVGHPDGFAYADRLLGLNYPDDYTGLDGLKMRGSINQIGQIPMPMTTGCGYTVLPRSGFDSFPGRDKAAAVQLDNPIFQDLWLCSLKNKPWAARLFAVADAIRQTAQMLSPSAPGT